MPLLARGLAVAGDTLFVAGPEDLLDEPGALNAMDDAETLAKLEAQAAALTGESGGLLHAVACADGTTLSETRLETIPVWDGLAVANGGLYMAGVDGTARCYRPE